MCGSHRMSLTPNVPITRTPHPPLARISRVMRAGGMLAILAIDATAVVSPADAASTTWHDPREGKPLGAQLHRHAGVNCSTAPVAVDLVAVRMLSEILSAPNASRAQWVNEVPAAERGQQLLEWHCCNPHVPATYTCSEVPVVPKDWPFCPDYTPRLDLDYSFGIDNQWGFDDTAANHGAEVHSFDPTVKNIAKHSAHKHRGVHFHPWGLAAGIKSSTSCHERPRGDARGRQGMVHSDAGGRGQLAADLFTLPTIRERLGHESRRISVLKLDCEGCEWDTFSRLLETSRVSGRSILDDVDVLLVELHPGLLLSTDSDLAKFGDFFHYVILQSGFRVWWQHPNSGGKDRPGVLRSFHPMLTALGLDPLVCCYELALVRPATLQAHRRSHRKMQHWYAEEAAKARGVPHPCPHCLGN